MHHFGLYAKDIYQSALLLVRGLFTEHIYICVPVPRLYANISVIIHCMRVKTQSWSRNVTPSMQPEYSFLCAFEKFRKATASCDMSVRPRGKTRLPLDGFSLNFVFEYFSKISWENSSFLKSDKNNGYFTRRPIYIFDHISLSH